MIKAIFFDLDNTIYPVSSISDKLFKTLFAHIKNSGEYKGNWTDIKDEIQRTPFQKVANDFSFSPLLKKECMKIHIDLTYNEPINTFEDYSEIRQLPQKKYLITSGFTKLQNSKIVQLGIQNDFEAIYIIDLHQSQRTKKEVFQQILEEQDYKTNEVLVVGDDLVSEIKAGKELGIATVLYNKLRKYAALPHQNTITNFSELKNFI